jgi:hypothetical protein
MGGLHCKAQMSEGARRRACSETAAMCKRSYRGHVKPYSRVNVCA